ncbi:MAG: alpha/beta hydrolase [Firmicutes bacterium]|nr:alpha/beta hydrolase [Bacillota bacterium]
MEHKIFPLPQGNIHYWISKCDPQKPWLVFLPGLTADHTLFETQIAYFTSHCNCFVWDAPAHGQSRPFSLTFTMEDMAEDLHNIFKSEEINKPIFIGQSLGGYIAQVFIDRYPDVASAFISIDSCPLSRRYYAGWELAFLKHTLWMYMSIPWKLLLKWGIWGTATTAYGRKLMDTIWSAYEKKEFCLLTAHGYRILAQAVEAKTEYPLPCPVLLLCGEKDAAGSAKRYNREWTKQEGHILIWLKDAGHNSNTDVPDKVNSIIEDFINSI